MMPNNNPEQVGVWLTDAELTDFDRVMHNNTDDDQSRELREQVLACDDGLFYIDEDTSAALLRALTKEITLQQGLADEFTPTRAQRIRTIFSLSFKRELALQQTTERATRFADNAARYIKAADRLCGLLQEQRMGRAIHALRESEQVSLRQD